MAIIKDPYEISIWGTESTKRVSAVSNTLTYENPFTDDTLPLVINVPPTFATTKRIRATVNNTNIDLIAVNSGTSEISGFYGGSYNSKAHMMVKGYGRKVITWKNMAKSPIDNGKWRYYPGLVDIIDISKRNSANNKARLQNSTNLVWGSTHKASDWAFFITKEPSGRVYICPPDNISTVSDDQKFEIIYPLLNTEEVYLESQKPSIIVHHGTNTITASYSTAATGTSYTSISDFYAPSHISEYKICVIGTDTLNSNFRVVEPRFVENINGTHTLTFKMYYVINGELSPYTEYLFNEQRIKLKWKNKWYDLVIKNVSKDSSDKSYTYTCKDLYENELSKTGYNLIFDNELQNNQGTVEDLARRVVQGTDWAIDQADTIKQEYEEPVYEIEIASNKQMTDVWNQNNNPTKDPGIEYEKVPADPVDGESSNRKILLYYSVVQSLLNDTSASGTKEIQFAYSFSDYKTEVNSQSVINENCYAKELNYTVDSDNNTISFSQDSTLIFTLNLNTTGVSSQYRATRLVDKVLTTYDPLVEKYVEVYNANSTPDKTSTYNGMFTNGDTIYHYTATEFDTPQSVNNLIVNNKDFLNLEGWNVVNKSMTTKLYPVYDGEGASYNGKSYLMIPATDITNRGLSQYLSFLSNGIQKGDKFILRYRAFYGNGQNPLLQVNKQVTGLSGTFKIINSAASKPYSTSFIEREGTERSVAVAASDIPGATDAAACAWREATFIVKQSLTKEQLETGNYLFYFKASSSFWLKEMEFFPLKMGLKPLYDEDGKIVYEEGEMCTEEVRMEPGDCDFLDLSHIIHYYYDKTKNTSKTKEGISYVYKGEEGTTNYNTLQSFLTPQTNQFSKIGTINISKSNRFNILQEIAQTFKCWCRFNIEHSEDGRILSRSISYLETIGQETGIGFEYGTDLRSVSRTIQSEQFTTKIIVPNNANQFGENGFCSIQRSLLNYPRVNYILNFDYYINRGFIDEETITNDLYNQNLGMGYFTSLNTYNLTYDAIAEQLAQYRQSLSEQESVNSLATKDITSIQEQINNLKSDLTNLAEGTSYESTLVQNFITENMDKKDIVTNRVKSISKLEEDKAKNESLKQSSEKSITALKSQITNLENKLESVVTSIEKVDAEFMQKYSSFIREGTWQDESYYDDDKYYLAAQEVAYTSSRPQVSYNISVIRLSALEDFKTKVFGIGDIAYVQDTEFFGYLADGITPYKELVVISEITSYLDEPDKDTITVQNYRTQFEDLFQRITASVQALQYNEGSYNKVANIITTGGALNQTVIEKSFSEKILNYTTYNENIKQDNTGITVSDIVTPNLKSWLSPTGIKITEDGGATWKNVINGTGIETNELKSGTIYTQDIMIMDRDEPAFRWNEEGITAYEPNEGSAGLNQNKITRFDHYGIYGINQTDKYEVVINRNFGNTAYYSFDDETGDYIRATGTPTNGVTYYTLTGSGAPIEVTNFASGTNYYKYSVNADVYIENSDVVPKYGTIYYTRVTLSSGATEFDGYDYYEYNSAVMQYFATEDDTPQQGKTYYRFEQWDGGFKDYSYPSLYKLNNSNYELLDEDTEYSSGLVCYVIEVENTMPATFNPGVEYYKEVSGEYIRDFEETAPVAGEKYAIIKNYEPSSEDDIWDVADYGLTWNGFFLRSRTPDGGPATGRIEISSTDDIRVKSRLDETEQYRDRIIIGRLEHNEYGIQINNSDGEAVLVTDSTGDLWLKNILKIGVADGDGNSNIKIGYWEESPNDWKVFSAVTNEGSFVINADGTINATNGNFSGIIHATGGEFTGTLTAATGNFTGEIFATSGSIGGFTISENQLSVGNLSLGDLQGDLDLYTIYTPYFQVSKDGKISADSANITGAITATSGSIGGINIEENKIVAGILEIGDLPSIVDWGESVARITTEDGSIVLNIEKNGSIYLSGEIHASSGMFEGDIIAQGGSIGGWSIRNNSLKITPTMQDSDAIELGDLSEPYADYVFRSPNFKIGKDGRIEATKARIYGEVHAESGTFDGTITASSGKIAAFDINGTELSIDGLRLGILANYIPFTGSAFAEGEVYYEYNQSLDQYVRTNDSTKQVGKDYFINADENQVINSQGNFILYRDGSIYSTSGTIGGWKITNNSISIQDPLNSDNYLRLNAQDYSIAGPTFYLAGKYSKDDDTKNWSQFENVKISGSLGATVFEVNSVQAIGGAMLVRPAFTIIKAEEAITRAEAEGTIKYNITLEENIAANVGAPLIKVGDYVLINCSPGMIQDDVSKWSSFSTRLGYVLSVDTENGANQIQVIVQRSDPLDNASVLVTLDGDSPTAIGISSNTTSFGHLLLSEGITISKMKTRYRFEEDNISSGAFDDSGKYEVNVFLGNFDANTELTNSITTFNPDTGGGMTGYGLYADNVYLKGALYTAKEYSTYKLYEGSFQEGQIYYEYVDNKYVITEDTSRQTGKNYYIKEEIPVFAGVNTHSIVNPRRESDGGGFGSEMGDSDLDGHIIFWGGANGYSATSIQESPFYVTDKGNLYARSGYFTGTIITKSTITASEIRTARIFGTAHRDETDEESENPGLILYNSDYMISFRNYTKNGEYVNHWDAEGAQEEEVFYIGNGGFYLSENTTPFIKIYKENTIPQIDFNGNKLLVNNAIIKNEELENYLEIDDQGKIAWFELNNSNITEDASIRYDSDLRRLLLRYSTSNLSIDSDSLEFSGDTDTDADISNIYFGKSSKMNTGNLKFARNSINTGFDVYVL